MRAEQETVSAFVRKIKSRLFFQGVLGGLINAVSVLTTVILLSPPFYFLARERYGLAFFIIILFVLIYLAGVFIHGFLLLVSHQRFFSKLPLFLPTSLVDGIRSAIGFISMKDHQRLMFSQELVEAHIQGVNFRLKDIGVRTIRLLMPADRVKLVYSFVLVVLIGVTDYFTGAYKNVRAVLTEPAIISSGEIVRSIDINYIFPSYTGFEPILLKNTDGNIVALRGTTAELIVSTGMDAESGEIVLEDGERFPMVKSQNTSRLFKGQVLVEKNAEYTIELKRGRKIFKDQTKRHITAGDDGAPVINAYMSVPKNEVSPGDNIIFLYSAKDDFGIQKVVFKCEADSGRQFNPTVKEPPIVSKEVSGEYIWRAGEMNLKNSKEVSCFFIAIDNDTVSGPKEGYSQKFYFKVGLADYRERLMEEIRGLFEGFVDILGDVLVVEREGINLKFLRDTNNKLVALRKNTLNILNSSGEIQGQAGEIIRKTLSELDAILGILKDTTTVSNWKNIGTITEKLEDIVLSLYTLIKLGRYELFMDSAEDILSLQQSLLEEFKKGKEGALYNKIQDLEQKIAEAFAHLGEGATGAVKEFINVDALKRMGMPSLFDKLNKIKSLLKEGRVEEARRLYEEFMSEYAKMIASMQEFLNSTTFKEFGEFIKKLEGIQSEIKQLKSREAKIKSALKNFEPRNVMDIHKWLVEELKKVEELIRKIELLQKWSGKINTQDLAEARRRAELVKISLQSMNIFDGLTEARNSLRALEEAKNIISSLGDEKIMSEMESTMALNREIIADIEKMLQNLSASMDQKSKEKLRSLAEEQAGLERKARELSTELQKTEGENKFLKTPLPGMLSGAADFMKGARNRMEEGDAPGGVQNADEAIKQLGKIDDYIEDMKSGTGMPVPFPVFGYREMGSGYGSARGRVELPGEQESAYQKEIKEELLKAIRGGLPEKLEEQNRKYIKELMK